jgi:cystathionine beta-lyase family protein involved in aluminum resistance
LPVIGLEGKKGDGSLADFGVEYRQVELREGDLDLEGLRKALAADKEGRIKVVYLQRSKGYLSRKTLSVGRIAEAVKLTRSLSKARVMVDNCYGEFTSAEEPPAVGADLIAGSLIKNPGGGMAENGGYLAGTGEAVRLAGYRMTTVGVGGEGGATLGQNKALIKGFFYAPHTVCQALKTAAFAAYLFGRLGMPVSPRWDEERADIIQTVTPGSPEKLIAFCKGLQAGSPVDAFASPEPSPMPGYSDKVIMAAGAFTQGSSIELSADGPLREPYTVFLQGGLTYESGRYGVISAAKAVLALS